MSKHIKDCPAYFIHPEGEFLNQHLGDKRISTLGTTKEFRLWSFGLASPGAFCCHCLGVGALGS